MKHLTTAVLTLVFAAGALTAVADPNDQNGQNGQNGQHQHTGGPNGQQGQNGQHTGGPGAGNGHAQALTPAPTPVVTPITTPNPTPSPAPSPTPTATGAHGGPPNGWNNNNGRGGLQYRNGPNGQTQQSTGQNGWNNGQRGPGPGFNGGPPRQGVGVGIAIGGNGVHVGFAFQQHAPRGRDAGRGWYNANAFPRFFTVGRRFHAPQPFYPGGWYYRPWNYGEYLPAGWFAPNFYLNWGLYGLSPPPIGCEWVQEGRDALLVDVWSGEVLSVYRGVFW